MIDRHFMIWDTVEDKMVTARHTPNTLLITANIENGKLTLSYKNTNETEVVIEEVTKSANIKKATLWGSTIDGFDCGDRVSQWLSTQLDAPQLALRLLYYSHSLAEGNKRGLDQLLHNPPVHKLFKSLGRNDKVAFPDTTPFDLGTEESLKDLNSRLDKPLTFRSFRPNFVIKGCPKPFDEDNWSELKIGNEARFTNVSHCSRCVLTTIDPETALKDAKNQPLKVLRQFRLAPDSERDLYGFSPLFCINLGIDSAGFVKLGDPVYARYK